MASDDPVHSLASAAKRPMMACDPCLSRFFGAQCEAEEEEALAVIIATDAEPLIAKILQAKLGYPRPAPEVEDLASRVVMLLLARLQQLKSDPDLDPLHDFRHYVATTTFRVYHDYLRQK